MKIYIKNMVCNRCIIVVTSVLNDLELRPVNISLGEADFGDYALSDAQVSDIWARLEPLGFEVINDKKSRLIERIKKQVIKLVQKQDGLPHSKLSDYMTENIAYEYNYLSTLFSSIEGMTIERYYINQKIEKVKELLVYDELSLTEISFQMGYSSLAHLSNQFKSVTGLSPSHFRRLKSVKSRISIDRL
ncbi:Transcriptional regulator, AraC family [hydrothermal vent metagenome]|uniref:Transcriptional regulator, AraC family n=1 Tax=hydrothermal vent metagenome TaxID=652676 RepID=A0A3B1AZA9_9ZZZZ